FEEITPCEADARLIMDWRNDPVARAMSYHGECKVWPGFLEEYQADYFLEADVPSYFALLDGERVAFVRFQPYADASIPGRSVSLGINLASSLRRRGVGAAILEAAPELMFARGYENVVGEIKVENRACIR